MTKRGIGLMILALLICLLSLGVGRYEISIDEVVKALVGQSVDRKIYNVIMTIRLPRVALVMLCGMALGLSGYLYQHVFQNPLVSPDVVGASSGCSLGAAFAIVLLDTTPYKISLGAFAGGVVAVICAVLLAKCIKGKLLGLVLSGIIINAVGASLLMLLKYIADPYEQLPTIEFWLMGGFYHATYEQVYHVAWVVGIGLIGLYLLKWQLKVSQLDDLQAKALGVPIGYIQIMAISLATLLVAVSVAVAGLISWIGLIAPHLAKITSGKVVSDRPTLSMAWGIILLISADTLSRTLFPAELPISVLTSLIGAVLLILVLLKTKTIFN